MRTYVAVIERNSGYFRGYLGRRLSWGTLGHRAACVSMNSRDFVRVSASGSSASRLHTASAYTSTRWRAGLPMFGKFDARHHVAAVAPASREGRATSRMASAVCRAGAVAMVCLHRRRASVRRCNSTCKRQVLRQHHTDSFCTIRQRRQVYQSPPSRRGNSRVSRISSD